ncbi:MAG: hypothetical protein K5640_08785 [Treponema sp.]|nr:hypothetical protein [Treponema sp.]
MNTIPSIFNERQINMTVLGGSERMSEVKMNISVVLINSFGSHFRLQMLDSLMKMGFKSIISIEPDPDNYNIEEFVSRFPSVRFIVPLEKVTDGDLINIGIGESEADYVLVIRDSLRINPSTLTPNLAEKTIEACEKAFCIVPRLLSSDKRGLPIRFAPCAERGKLTIETERALSNGIDTLYPFNYIGLYNRQKFMQLGGFDYTITSAFWQNLDLSFRAWLWGEKVKISTAFQIEFSQEIPVEDRTPDLSSLRFYLKNLMPKFKADCGIVPFGSFISYLLRSNCGFFETRHQFLEAKRWIGKNKYRFKMDAPELIKNWNK